ncbi:hypothetical protein F2Q69_00000308 [Brassica cretica]|uniref:Uncharacterized protein n=1 Tax=Brassica cretica TaxID=69181 RepID=A0A8S9PEC7_BRACR|nr:hypothetical protein F2Q69_00000308 [Brassica cretica]
MDAKSRYRSEFRDSGGVENQSVQELESYAVYKSQETTKTVQGGEKLLGSLGGIFSRTWKPNKSRSITGPVMTRGGLLLLFLWSESLACPCT